MAIKYSTDTFTRFRQLRRPVSGLLPGIVEGSLSQSSESDLLTSWIDKSLSELVDLLLQYPDLFDPETTPAEFLDLLSIPCGFVEDYWDVTWTEQQKRWMLSNSIRFIWPARGTQQVLEAILDNFNLLYEIWQDGDLLMPFAMPAQFGIPKLRFFVLLPLSIEREGKQWKLAETLTRQYSTAGVEKGVYYDSFYLGFSKFNDPMFEDTSELLLEDENFTAQNPLEEQRGGIPLANSNDSALVI